MDTVTSQVLAEERRNLEKNLERNKEFSKWLNAVAGAAAAAALTGAIVGFVSERSNIDFFDGDKAAAQARSEFDHRIVRRLGQMQVDVASLRKAQAAIAQLPPDSKTGVQLNALNSRLDTLDQRLDRLEQAIQSTPERALTMPLMRRDIDNMRESNAQNVASIKASVDQVYDLTKWLLGALAVGVFSLVMSNYLQRKSD